LKAVLEREFASIRSARTFAHSPALIAHSASFYRPFGANPNRLPENLLIPF
jgi:hypothetical protein